MVNFEKWLQFFKKWLQFLKKCSHVTVIFDEFDRNWPQLSTFCSHISNYDCNFQHFAVTFRIMTATFNILQSHFELWLQNVESCSHVIADFEMWPQNVENCSHNSKCDCNFQHFAVTFRNLQSRDCNFRNVTAIFQNLQSRDCRFWKIAVTFLKLQSRDCRFRNLTAKCWKLQSHFEIMTATFQHFAVTKFAKNHSHVTAFLKKLQSFFLQSCILIADFEIWSCSHISLQSFCSHILKVAVTWLQILKCDRDFQHFAVTFRIMTATFNILRSHFKLWLQNVEICGHISNFAVRNGLLKLMARHTYIHNWNAKIEYRTSQNQGLMHVMLLTRGIMAF